MIILSNWVIFIGSMLIFRGVNQSCLWGSPFPGAVFGVPGSLLGSICSFGQLPWSGEEASKKCRLNCFFFN